VVAPAGARLNQIQAAPEKRRTSEKMVYTREVKVGITVELYRIAANVIVPKLVKEWLNGCGAV
jgi:hypothetical protein